MIKDKIITILSNKNNKVNKIIAIIDKILLS
jgi:hypothetical protein